MKVIDASTSTAIASTSARSATEGEVQIPEAEVSMEEGVVFNIYANPASMDNFNLQLEGLADAPVQVRIVDL